MTDKAVNRMATLALLLGAGLIALLILSTRSCAIDGHHEITKQVKACAGIGGIWHDDTDYSYTMAGHCEMKK